VSTAFTALNPPAATEIRQRLLAGELDVVDLHEQLLARAQAADTSLHAFVSLEPGAVRAQAARCRDERAAGQVPGPLFGVPVAVKDIIDTADFPTGHGSPIHAGRCTSTDATVVRRLRGAGAVIFGKTVTTEFATFHPGPTRNPHALDHTPGGSSSGSAAAVAAGLVPLALGTQTNGSVLRPASYCGVYGYKPTRGLLPRTGVFPQSPTLDQIGVFARHLEDAALAVEVMSGDDGVDAGSRGQPPRPLRSLCMEDPPAAPRFAFVRTPWWDRVDAQARAALDAFVASMPGIVDVLEMPAIAGPAVAWHAAVNESELAVALQSEYRHHAGLLSPALRERVAAGMQLTALDYLDARSRMQDVANAFDPCFERYDAILSPAALGPAPRGLASTGNPLMQTVWTFAGMPAVSLPLLTLDGGLPLGVQAVGPLHHDARLLRACRWLVQAFEERHRP
jgi:Asp-tRNA(Asn)/Glu-tRNA(Gln) amidotransferase A subunit family amidase